MTKSCDTPMRCPSCQGSLKDYKAMICNKCKRFLNTDKISLGDKIVYAPNRQSIIRGVTDNAYESFGFYPGDKMTVKEVEIDERDFKYILVEECEARFSPFELVPEAEYKDDLKKSILELFMEINRKYKE